MNAKQELIDELKSIDKTLDDIEKEVVWYTHDLYNDYLDEKYHWELHYIDDIQELFDNKELIEDIKSFYIH